MVERSLMENQNGSLTHCLHRVAADPRSDIRLPMLRHRNALGEISYLPPHCPDCGGKLVARPMVEGPSHLYECAGAGFHFADHRVAAFSNRTSVAHVGCGSRFMRRPDSRSGFWAGDPSPGPLPFPLPVWSGNPLQRKPSFPFGGFPDPLVLASLPVAPPWCASGVRSIPISGLSGGRVALPGAQPAALPAPDSASSASVCLLRQGRGTSGKCGLSRIRPVGAAGGGGYEHGDSCGGVSVRRYGDS